jgi:hypothetical protein
MIPGQFRKQLVGVDPLDVRFLEINNKPWPDKRRITIQIRLLPFNTAPSLEFAILEKSGQIISEVMIVETQDHEIEFTMHIPEKTYENPLQIKAAISYEAEGQVDNRIIPFDL